jgi:hypothetical protein
LLPSTTVCKDPQGYFRFPAKVWELHLILRSPYGHLNFDYREPHCSASIRGIRTQYPSSRIHTCSLSRSPGYLSVTGWPRAAAYRA